MDEHGFAQLLAACLAGLFVLAQPSSLPAACGDHVQPGAGGKRGAATSRDLPLLPAHRAPCHGPRCGGSPAQPPLLPVSVPPLSAEQPAWLGPAVGPVEQQALSRPEGPAHGRPLRRASRIERPPRARLSARG